MADSRDKRNFGCGRRLDHLTISRLAEKTAHLANRGSGLALQARSALGRISEYLRDAFTIQDLEKCSRDHVINWIEDDLRPAVIEGELSRATAAFYLSSINTVFRMNSRNAVWVSAREYGIARGQKYTNADLSNRQEDVRTYQAWLLNRASTSGGIRSLQFQALAHSIVLEWTAGLRFRESLMAKIGRKVLSGSGLALVEGDGCKNNRAREVQVLDGGCALHEAQRFVLERAKDFKQGSLIPSALTYKQHKAFARNALQSFRGATGRSLNHHGNRHAFALEGYARLYEQKTGVRIEAPVKEKLFGQEHIASIASRLHTTESEAKELDNQVRLELSNELGHGRVDVTWSYVGR
jgi:hypothetical protein